MTETTAERPVGSLQSDEVSIGDLLLILWRYRYLGLVSFIVTILSAVIYMFWVSPVYQTSAFLLPPLSRDIETLNIQQVSSYQGSAQGFQNYTIDSVFEHFLKNLRSRELRRDFFLKQNLYGYYGKEESFEQVFDRRFNSKLNIIRPDEKGKTIFTKLVFELNNPEKAASLLNQFLQSVSHYTVNELTQNVIYSIRARMKFLREEILSKRKLAEERRKDLIVQLSESLRIAEKLGIKTPVDYNTLANASVSSGVSVNTGEMPLYARGSAALQAEIVELRARASDDPYIEGLRNLQEELTYLEAIDIQDGMVKVTRIDQLALPPEERLSPKRVWVLLVAGIAGIFLYILIAFVAHITTVLRREIETKQNKF